MPDPTPRESQSDANRRQRSRRLELLVRDRWPDRSGMSGLAKTIGVSRATLYSWLRGDTVPDLDTMSRLAGALGLTPSELLALVGESEPVDVMSPRQVRSMPAMREAPVTINAWDPEWVPPLRAQRVVESPSYAMRPASPMRRDVRLLDVLVGSEVMSADADEPIGPVAERMYERAYSQVPVYRGKNLVGLLTADAIARWVGSVQGRPRHSSDRTTVGEVLALAEATDSLALADLEVTVQGVLERFDHAMHEGAPLTAVLVARNGAATEKPVGIVTVADLPRLRRFSG
jgi:predicted transcriptional regulator